MRTITATILVALLTFTVGFGTVAAKPKADNPNRGNGAITFPFKISGTSDRVGGWSCSGVYVQNKNHTRINAECTVANVLSYAGTYTNETHDIPGWTAANSDVSHDVPDALLEIAEDIDPATTDWRVVVTPNADGVSGTVDAVVLLKTK